MTDLLVFYWDLGSKMLVFLTEMNFLARTGRSLPQVG